jgi:hypothetical protein
MKNLLVILFLVWLVLLPSIRTQPSVNPVWHSVAHQLQQAVMNLVPIFSTGSDSPIRYII